MAYIGKTPVIGNFQKCDSISVVNGQAAYTLQVGGVNVSPQSENHMLVSLNGILQAPVDSFTVSGSTLTFASNLVTGDVIDFVMILGNVLDLGVPSDNTVSLAKLTATGTKDATTFLRGDNTFATVVSGLTMADQWRITADHTAPGVISSNWEQDDSYNPGIIGSAMTQSSGIFTFPSTGIYSISFGAYFRHSLITQYVSGLIEVTTNNSSYNIGSEWISNIPRDTYYNGGFTQYFFDVTDTSNCKVRFSSFTAGSAGVTFTGNTNTNYTFANFTRLGDT